MDCVTVRQRCAEVSVQVRGCLHGASLSTAPPAFFNHPCARAAMALLSLSGDEQRILFTQLCNVLDPASPWP